MSPTVTRQDPHARLPDRFDEGSTSSWAGCEHGWAVGGIVESDRSSSATTVLASMSLPTSEREYRAVSTKLGFALGPRHLQLLMETIVLIERRRVDDPVCWTTGSSRGSSAVNRMAEHVMYEVKRGQVEEVIFRQAIARVGSRSTRLQNSSSRLQTTDVRMKTHVRGPVLRGAMHDQLHTST